MSSSDNDHGANRLLARMSRADFASLAPHLEVVPLSARDVLFEAGKPVEEVYFPHSGVICLMAALRDGVVETAAVGSEGFIGFEAVLGGDAGANRALVQLSGSASRVSVKGLRAAMRRHPGIRDLLLRYMRYFLVQILQSVACSKLHEVEERCARWLLMAHDRARTDSFNLTQEFLAETLGVHRPTVTLVARTMQEAGLIRYSRGTITIMDRKGLEEATCECYGITRRALAEIFPHVSGRPARKKR
jgi:CRP-like cAMP-binding protein